MKHAIVDREKCCEAKTLQQQCKGIVSVSIMLFPAPFYFSWFPPVDSWLVHLSQYLMDLDARKPNGT